MDCGLVSAVMEDIVVGVCTSSVLLDEGIGDDEDMAANVVSREECCKKKKSWAWGTCLGTMGGRLCL